MDDPGTVCDDKLTMNKWITIQFFGAMFAIFGTALGVMYMIMLDYESRITTLELQAQYGRLVPLETLKRPEGETE